MRKSIFSLLLTAIMIFASNTTEVYCQHWGMYTLYAPRNGTNAYLSDKNDLVYKTWAFPSNKVTVYSAYLTPGDTLVRTYKVTIPGGMTGGGISGGVQKVLWDGTVAWDFQYCGTTYTLHHDIHPMPNGNVLMIAYEIKTTAEAAQAGAASNVPIWSEKIIEVKPTGLTSGIIVWEWRLWDHLCQSVNPAKDNYVSSILNNPQLLNINYTIGTNLTDRWHMNGLDYNAALDQVVFSVHFLNSVFVIDHSTTTAQAAGHTAGNSGKGGDFLYRWGNPASYNAAGTTIFNVIHDAHWVPSDNPKYPDFLCAYNNLGAPGSKTAITIWRPPYNGYNYTHTSGQAYLPSTYAYQYNTSFNAQNEGNSQQLPNGNMIINNSFAGAFEIDSLGTVLWSKSNTASSHVYRYSLCYVRGPVVKCQASDTQVAQGTPVTLSALVYSPTETNPVYTYTWSSNPPGFSSSSPNPSVTPATNTFYTVTVTNTLIGCSASSTVAVNITTGIKDIYQPRLKIYPIPAIAEVTIEISAIPPNGQISLLNLNGQPLIMRQITEAKTHLDINNLPNGVYFVKIAGEKTLQVGKVIKKK